MDMMRPNSALPAGATLPVKSVKVALVYDEADGRIHHHHRVLTLEGGHEPSEAEMERDALNRVTARRSGHPGGSLKVLHVAHDALQPGQRYRVDLAKKALVAE